VVTPEAGTWKFQCRMCSKIFPHRTDRTRNQMPTNKNGSDDPSSLIRSPCPTNIPFEHVQESLSVFLACVVCVPQARFPNCFLT
jgi:hypothetical protein